jgi:2-polyprenyl-3-methyl-5-hydroxy-6-metoxy-1,4-benzoquinol methylase
VTSGNGKRIVQAGYDDIAAQYLATRSEDSADVQLLGELIQRLDRGAHVLDAGCGSGVPVTRILSRTFQVTGVDFSEEQITLARQLVPEAQFVCQDMTELTSQTTPSTLSCPTMPSSTSHGRSTGICWQISTVC